uniref:Decapping nuclease n=1 Tax=Heterorhabditis bacteriophora TaxID=37862 RepID=A0A1I7XBI5_HETBA
MRLVYSGEVDAIDEVDGELSLKWWLQSFLIGIKNIVVGFRDNHGIVGSVRTEDLPKRGEWNGNACLNLLSSVLSTVRSQLSSDGLACVVRFDPIEKHISLQEEPFQDVDVLTQSFRSHFQLN